MKKQRNVLLILFVLLLHSFAVHATETRIYSNDGDGTFLPVEITNVKLDSIENIPGDIEQFMNDENIDSAVKAQVQHYIDSDAYTSVPTFLKIRASQNTGGIIIHAQAPCKITFLDNGIHTLNYLENGEGIFTNNDSSNYSLGERVPLDVDFYRTYQRDPNNHYMTIYGETLYTFDEATQYCQNKFNQRYPDNPYVYKEPSPHDFAGAKGNSVTLGEGEYYMNSESTESYGASGYAYYYRYYIKVENPKNNFLVTDNVVKNVSDSTQTVTVIIADFMDKMLVGVRTEVVTLKKGESREFEYGNGTKHRIFIWNSLEEMEPLV